MRILLDTNILILRENNHIVPENLAHMMNLISGLEASSTWVHPLSIDEIKKDGNLERQAVNLSKISGYAILDTYPDYNTDDDFKNSLPIPLSDNDVIDNQLIYSVTKNVVDYLITEDQGILNKAENLGLEQVLNINEAISCFQKFYPNSDINLLPTFQKKKGYEINIKDEIFGTLENEYEGFANWWNSKVSRRELFVYENDNKINAILIPKIEERENIDCTPSLYRDKILKICTFKVAEHSRGLKLGERLLRMAFDYAIANNIEEIYLTHFKQESDYLIPLIQNFGFYKYGKNSLGEEVYLKRIIPNENLENKDVEDIISINRKYYPSFYDGSKVKKHLIPIRPNFHKKLFPDFIGKDHQLTLLTLERSEGNSIKKAYICNSSSRLINKGDILLFYQTQERKSVTTIGTVEAVYYGLRDAEQIFKLIAKRTVFNLEEVKECCTSDVTVILFNQNFNLENEVEYNQMEQNNIVNGYIQSITNIDDERYRKVIKDNIDERFIIN